MGITVICLAVKADIVKQDKFASREAALPSCLCFAYTACVKATNIPNSWRINPDETFIPTYPIKIPNVSIHNPACILT